MPKPIPQFDAAMANPMRFKAPKRVVPGFDPLKWKPSQADIIGGTVASAMPTEAMDAWAAWLKQRGPATKLGDTPGSTSLADLEAFLATLFGGR